MVGPLSLHTSQQSQCFSRCPFETDIRAEGIVVRGSAPYRAKQKCGAEMDVEIGSALAKKELVEMHIVWATLGWDRYRK